MPLAMPIPFIYCMGKTAGYGSAALQLTERVSEIAFFCLAWFGLDAGQAFHVQLCWLAFFVDAGSVCLLPKAATLWFFILGGYQDAVRKHLVLLAQPILLFQQPFGFYKKSRRAGRQ